MCFFLKRDKSIGFWNLETIISLGSSHPKTKQSSFMCAQTFTIQNVEHKEFLQ